MLTSIVVSIVRTCTRFAYPTLLIALVLATAAGYYTSRNFEINTDINTLISPDLDWRKRDNQFDQAFDRDRTILAVVDAPTPELTSVAGAALERKLSGDTQHFESVQALGAGEFFEKNGLLFLPVAEVGELTSQFESAAPLIEIMAEGSTQGRGVEDAEVRRMFTREYLMASDWYGDRLRAKQTRDVALWTRHVRAIEEFRDSGSGAGFGGFDIESRLAESRKQLTRVSAPEYLSELEGTIGADPCCGASK